LINNLVYWTYRFFKAISSWNFSNWRSCRYTSSYCEEYAW